MDRLTNEEVLRRAQNPKRLLSSIIGRRLSYLGHILRSDTLERELIVGMVHGTIEVDQRQDIRITSKKSLVCQ